MIEISDLSASDLGRWVVYTDTSGGTERGKIKSWNNTWIHVVFKCGDEWERFEDFTGNACSPDNLNFDIETIVSLKDWLTV